MGRKKDPEIKKMKADVKGARRKTAWWTSSAARNVMQTLLVVFSCPLMAGVMLLSQAYPLPELGLIIAAGVVVGLFALCLLTLFGILPGVSWCMSFSDGVRGVKRDRLLDKPGVKLDLWLMNHRKTVLLQVLKVAVAALVAIGCLWVSGAVPGSCRYLQWALGAVAVAAILRLVFQIRKYAEYLERDKDMLLCLVTVIGTALVGITFWLPEIWGFCLPASAGVDLFGYYTAQLSLTFISISVMSVLSDRSVVIYWENIAQRKLIRPVFGSFASYTYYSIGTTVGAGISVLLGNGIAFYVFFGINVLVLILLTLTMVDVYYGREKKKRRLQGQLVLEFCAYQALKEKKDMLEFWKDTYDFARQELDFAQRYREHMLLLRQNIFRAKDEHDLVYLREVFDLYINHIGSFETDEGEQVVQILLANVGDESWSVMIDALKARLEKSEKGIDDMKVDPLGGDKPWQRDMPWNVDEAAWTALSQAPYLRQWLDMAGNSTVYRNKLWDFMELVLRRFVVLYNHMVLHYNLENKEKAALLQVVHDSGALWVKTRSGDKPNSQEVGEVFTHCFGALMVETSYLPRLVEIVAVMLAHLGGYYRDCLVSYYKEFSFFCECTPFLHMLLDNDEDIDRWQKAFPRQNP